jgi:uncharacterized protein (DUF1778 family)
MATTKTEPRPQLLLRLSPDEIESIRAAAKDAGQTISEYVLNLHQRRQSRTQTVDMRQFAALAEVSRNLTSIPEAVRKFDADLGRLSGRLKDLFALDYGKAMAHQAEITETLHAVRDLRAEIMPALAAIQVVIAAPRDAVVEIMEAIVVKRDAEALVEA